MRILSPEFVSSYSICPKSRLYSVYMKDAFGESVHLVTCSGSRQMANAQAAKQLRRIAEQLDPIAVPQSPLKDEETA